MVAHIFLATALEKTQLGLDGGSVMEGMMSCEHNELCTYCIGYWLIWGWTD